jgi:hypothetical protein
VEIKKDDKQDKKPEADVQPETRPNTQIEKRVEGTSAPLQPKAAAAAVSSSGQVLSVAEDTVKIKDKSGELELKLATYTKYYEIKPPALPALKDKSIVIEGATVLFEYDKGTMTLNSIMVQ